LKVLGGVQFRGEFDFELSLLKYLLVYLVKHLNFNLMYNISFFSQFVFDEFIAKGEEYVHKVGRTLTNRMVERRNMINIYLRGITCIESVRGSLILSFSLLFLWFAAFRVIY
jgi:hypothetical protein